MNARAWIAAPLPPPASWVLLRSARELPAGYGIFGSIQVGVAEPPLLEAQARAPVADLEADGVTSAQWQELFALFARMTKLQRAALLDYAEELLEAGAPASEAHQVSHSSLAGA